MRTCDSQAVRLQYQLGIQQVLSVDGTCPDGEARPSRVQSQSGSCPVPLPSQEAWHPVPVPGNPRAGQVTRSFITRHHTAIRASGQVGRTEGRDSRRQKAFWGPGGLSGSIGERLWLLEQAVVHAAVCPSGASIWAWRKVPTLARNLGGKGTLWAGLTEPGWVAPAPLKMESGWELRPG